MVKRQRLVKRQQPVRPRQQAMRQGRQPAKPPATRPEMLPAMPVETPLQQPVMPPARPAWLEQPRVRQLQPEAPERLANRP